MDGFNKIYCRVWILFVYSLIPIVMGESLPNNGPSTKHGPIFTMEPRTEFVILNTEGASLSCTAFGRPAPALEWYYSDGSTKKKVVETVPNLLTVLANNTLVFHPFLEEQYKKIAHDTKIRCQATNSIGTIISSVVSVKAVIISQYTNYNIRVDDVYVMRGSVAVLICKINPIHIKQYVTVTGWERSGVPLNSSTGGRFMEFSSGSSLHIYNMQEEDSPYQYRCVTVNELTNEVKYSDPASIYVIDPVIAKPEIIAYTTSLELNSGQDVILPCAADGFPLPTFRYFHNDKIIDTSDRLSLQFGNLVIDHASENDGGSYTCRAQNSLGIADVTTVVKVKATLRISINPTRQIVDSDKVLSLECNIIGFPIEEITWFKDGSVISDRSDNGNIMIHDRTILTVSNMHKRHEGIYQCFASNKWQSVQSSAEVILGAAKPSMKVEGSDVYIKPGGDVSLLCRSAANPVPALTWTLNGETIEQNNMYSVTTQTPQDGDITSNLNITSIDVQHGGLYSCEALNVVGQARTDFHVNVYGIPFIRAFPPVTAIADRNLTLQCHVSGYPVTRINWLRGNILLVITIALWNDKEGDNTELPLNHRHRVSDNGTLQITHVNKEDAGSYVCDARNSQHQGMQQTVTISVLVPPKIDPFQFSPKKVGDRVSISCVVSSGDLPLRFHWLKDGKEIPADLGVNTQATGSFSSLLSISKASTQHTGNYTCLCKNKAAQSNYTSHLAINVPPRWIVEPQNSDVILNKSENIDCVAYGIPTPKITWMKAASSLTPGNYKDIPYSQNIGHNANVFQYPNGSLSISKASESDHGFYLCQCNNGVGAMLSKVIFLTVHIPAYFAVKQKNYTVEIGSNITIECEAAGDQPLPISWSFHNQQMKWEDNPRLTKSEAATPKGKKSLLYISETLRSDSGFYVCSTINNFGSSSMVIHLLVQEPPEAPGRFRTVSLTDITANLRWNHAFDGNSPVLKYLITYQPMLGLDEPKVQKVPSNETTTLLKNLYPATMYHVVITSVNNIGESSKSDAIAFATKEAAPSGPPLNVQAYGISSTVIQVIWELPEVTQRNGILKGYYISYNKHNSTSPFMTINKASNNGSFEHINIVNLEKFTQYDINVQAYNAEGTGPKSTTMRVYTKEDVPESAPQSLQAVALTSQSVNVVWSPPQLKKLNGILQGYRLLYSLVIDGEVQDEATINSSRLSIVLTGLQKHSVYSIKVCAYTRVGPGIISDPVLVLTKQDIPDMPSDIKALSAGSNNVLVSWRHPLHSNGVLTKYTLYMKDIVEDKQNDIEYQIDPNEMSFMLHNLTRDQTYSFKISASTIIGQGEATRYVDVTPKQQAAARIASFSGKFIEAIYSTVLLPCISIGNPSPKSTWSMPVRNNHQDNSIVHIDGSLELRNITKLDEGTYKCTTENEHGKDEIQHSLIVLTPPTPAELFLITATLSTITVGWNEHASEYTKLKGFTVKYRYGHKQWLTHALPASSRNVTLAHLRCGTKYLIKVNSHNKIGNSHYSNMLQVKTNGSAPTIRSHEKLISHVNSTFVLINMDAWSEGSCRIMYFDIDILEWTKNAWSRVEHHISPDIGTYRLSVQPETWYTVKVTAHNQAGLKHAYLKFSTKTEDGGTIAPVFDKQNDRKVEDPNFQYYYLVIVLTAVGVVCLVASVWIYLHYRHRKIIGYGAQRLAQTRANNNTDISLLQDIEKEIETSVVSADHTHCNQQYSATPTRQLNVSALLDRNAATPPKTPIIYERRTVLFSSSNESFLSEKDGKITPYATFGPVHLKDTTEDNENTPLQQKIICHESPSTSYGNVHQTRTEGDGYMSPKRLKDADKLKENDEETKPLMV